MGKTVLNLKQTSILDAFTEEPFLTGNFYFTGGTALSEVYLQHRESIDLDFFSRLQFDPQKLLNIIESWSRKYKFIIKQQFVDPTYIYICKFADNEELKIDFATYPYKQLSERVVYHERLQVDSLLDISVNKLITLTQRAEAKDYVDLFYILQHFSFWELKEGVRSKFNVELEPFTAAADFAAVETIEFLPKMLTTLTIQELKSFFLTLAKKLGGNFIE
ncbi:nucleotidyl transferase AbiEii/AbiGii toxin family protein [Candidatus Gottesmanbacteria bacterium]|nr:nucleotidyl transferase AbiEii/AbiGii toxin family protein [Candidatus Gottesmanbacteria bacterium]